MILKDHSHSRSSWLLDLYKHLKQDDHNQMAGLVTRNKIDVSVLSDTTVSLSILFLVLVDLINCKGGHP